VIRVYDRRLARRLRGVFALLFVCGTAHSLYGQRDRIQAIDNKKRVTLAGHLHPRATPENDQGLAEDSLSLRNLTLVLKPSPQQQAALEDYLARLQNPSSPDYHHWLTPEEYAVKSGLSQADLDHASAWLQSQGLTVISTARGRNAISFRGPVRRVEAAFQTEIHRYLVNGQMHFANSTEPTVPAALNGIVSAIHGLNDFRPQARKIRFSPLYTSGATGNHYLAPNDIAAIYDVNPLYNTGIDGTGQKIAIVGQTQIILNDIQQFRTAYNLPPSDPQVVLVPGFPDPGVLSKEGDLGEADLDIEWSGAVARKATIIYVYSTDVEDALQYAVDQNVAPVISMSYGLCEALTGNADLTSLRQFAQQGSAQGITWLSASGDNGATDCFGGTGRSATSLAVDAPSSIPEVTGVGGTEFNEGTGAWWNPTNDANQASAIGYIPEMVWNDSVLDGSPAAGGGGASSFFAKPTWQTGPGVPNDSWRDVPDVSFAASADHDGYLFYSAGVRGAVGGTSVASPVFAGMLALLNQYQMVNGFQAAAGQGNINPQLYAMAQTSPGAFHDVIVGDNVVTPCARTRNCTALPVGNKSGVGYDTASGLGSVDAFNLITAWHLKGTSQAAVAMTVTSDLSSIPITGSTVLTATVASANAVTPTGTVTWTLAGVTLGSAALTGSAGKSTATLTVQGSALTSGSLSISALYSGDETYAVAAGTVSLTVTAAIPLTLGVPTNAASFKPVYAPGMILAIFGTGLAGGIQSTPFVPLPTQLNGVVVTINGLLCPLYFISPSQLNVQIPYSVPIGSALLKVSYNGQSASTSFTVTAAAPGIFTDSTGAPAGTGNAIAKRGQTVTLYVTGEGAATPTPTTGSTPTTAAIPVPIQTLSVTVGSVNVTNIPFKGIPSWAIGATQINYAVPLTAPVGSQPVVVTIGGVPSAPVALTVTP
jgi:uncharacterized protein (TIGR03437 family)